MSFSFGLGKITRGNSTYKDKPTGSTLPLYYKDKPSSSSRLHPASTSSKHKKHIVMLLKGFIYSMLLYAVYYFAANLGGSYFFNIPGGQSKWQRAQNEVRKAMLDSWHTYEKFGWGMMFTIQLLNKVKIWVQNLWAG